MHKQCLNCSFKLESSHKFCPACGQKTDTHRLSWHDVWHDSLHYLSHTDKGIFFVLKTLLLQPGLLIREYLQGRRKKYISPVTLLLICAGIAYVSINIFTLDKSKKTDPSTGNTSLTASGNTKQVITTPEIERGIKFNKFIQKNSKLITVAAMPIFALCFWLLLRKAGFNYIEHLAANFFISAITTLVYGLVLIPVAFFSGKNVVFLVGTFLFLIVEIAYRAWAYMGWLQYGTIGKKLAIIAYTILVTLIWSTITVGLGRIYISGILHDIFS
jgi:hypothetical protein